MKLILPGQLKQMQSNGQRRKISLESGLPPIDYKPVVKLFSPWGANTWLLTEIDEDQNTMFGLCDLGMGCPELGYVSLSEISSVKGPMGLHIERDIYFDPKKTLREYAEEAHRTGRISA